MRKYALLAAIAIWSVGARAATVDSNRIGAVRTSVQNPETGEWTPIDQGVAASERFSGSMLEQYSAVTIAAVVEFIKVGKEVWDVIKDNKSVYNVQTDTVAVLPKGVTDPMRLPNWRDGVSPSLKMEIDDIFGGNVLSFTYHINYSYNGQYLANIGMIPDDLAINGIGLKFQAGVQTLVPTNSGSRAAPVAQLKVLVPLKAEGWLNSAVKTDEFTIGGDGKVSVVQRSNTKWE